MTANAEIEVRTKFLPLQLNKLSTKVGYKYRTKYGLIYPSNEKVNFTKKEREVFNNNHLDHNLFLEILSHSCIDSHRMY